MGQGTVSNVQVVFSRVAVDRIRPVVCRWHLTLD